MRLIIALIILIPAAVIVIIGGVSLSGFAFEMMTEEVGILSNAQISGIKNMFDEYSHSLKSLANTDAVKQTAMGRYNNVEGEIKSRIAAGVENNENILDLIIMDSTGTVCADYIGRQAGSIFSGFNEAVVDSGKKEAYVSDISLSNAEYSGQNIFFFIYHITDVDETIGFVAYTISVNAVSNYLAGTEFFENGNIFIADKKGTAINYDNKPITRFEEITDSGISDIIAKNKGIISVPVPKYTSFKAGGYIGNYNILSPSNWIWFGIYPQASVSAMVSDVYMTSVIIILIVCVVCIIVMLFLTQYVIKPMNVIIQKMRNIAGGDREERFELRGSSEYARIGATFNEMIAEVSLSEELHRTISELSDNMLFEWDFTKEVMFLSDNFLNMFDIKPRSCTLLNGRFLDSLMENEYAEKYKRDINKLLKGKSSMEAEYKISTKTLGSIWILMRAHCVTDRLGGLIRIIGVITNINTEKKLSLQLAERASYDFLSQLYNRTTFERELQSELARSVTSRVAVIFIDVDDFKNINDKYGHSTGDEIIKQTSKVIKETVGKGGFAGRFGGDEFIMCITDSGFIDNIDTLAKNLITKLKEGYYSEQYDITLEIKASIGIAMAPEHGKECSMLIAAADEAMYCVKKKGKNDYHIYAPDDNNLIDIMHSI